MASGLPIIASNAGGLKELVINGENGFIYKSGNIPELIDTTIKMINLSLDECQILGENARNGIKSKNSIETIAGEYYSVYS